MSGRRYALDRVTAGRLQQKIEVRGRSSIHSPAARHLTIALSRKTNLDRSSGHLSTMRLEFSLIHKPLSLYRKVIDAAQNLSDIFMQSTCSCLIRPTGTSLTPTLVLRLVSVIREQIPRQETVLDVLKERKELVSSVMIVRRPFASVQPIR